MTKIPPVAPGRSYLFVPGDRQDRFDKAWGSGADHVIIDLEDAVAPAQKNAARRAAADWMTPERPVWLRINAFNTPWNESDIELAAHPGVCGFMIPKAEHLPPAFIKACLERKKRLIPLVETALGFKNLPGLAEAATVERLAFGSIDFQVDMAIEGEDDALAYFRSQLVLTSRLADIHPPIDGVTTDLNDPEVLRQDTLRAKRFGFGGKLCIHPRQVAPVNRIFLPNDGELAWARAVIQAANLSDGAIVTLYGKMIDKPVLAKAKRIVDAAIKAAEPSQQR
jgi:citrate lyase subunit beta/citryl-CoA lyase